MKKSFSILELILIIALVSIIGTALYLKPQENKLLEATKRIELYLKQTRYQALIDSKKNLEDSLWYRKRWTFKFFNCTNEQGIYYVIYSDENQKGHPNEVESLFDPLTNKRVYATNTCDYSEKRSKYVLLTKEFGVTDVDISCNSTNSLGQISFGENGNVYTRLGTKTNENEKYILNRKCEIKLFNKNKEFETIVIEPKTGYIHVK